MFKVNGTESARTAYKAIALFNKMPVKDGAVQDLIIETKRNLRKWTHRGPAVNVGLGFMVTRRLVKDDGIDGYVELVSIPDVFDTADAADEFFRDFLYMECRPSMYDCTGQAFTGWYKLFKRHGRYHAYHSVAVDV